MKLLDNIVKSCNPVIGCTYKGCKFCFAKAQNDRWKYIPDFNIPVEKPQALSKIHTRFSTTFFMNTMSDLADWDINYREWVFNEMRKYSHNKYFFLTKRPQQIKHLNCSDMTNVWIGVSITNRYDSWRIDCMKENIISYNYFVQFEPLLGDVGTIDLRGISHVIVGALRSKNRITLVPEISWIENIVGYADFYKSKVWLKDSLSCVLGNNLRQDYLPFLI